MSEKLLLLSGAKSGVLVSARRKRPHWLRRMAVVVGVLVILVGAADVVGRLSRSVSFDGGFTAFAPAITLIDPSALSRVRGSTATSSISLVPARLQVPSLGIDARVIPVKNNATGAMDTPKNPAEIAWYALGAKVGEAGNAVFAGHVNNALTTAGVFVHLSQIQQGDRIIITDKEGKELVYTVSEIANYPKDEAPSAVIFTKIGPSGVVLITCDGEWNTEEGSFDKRFVVFAKPSF